MDLDAALAQLFTARQKEIIEKKSKGDLLTKTEKEYYSHAIKKRIVAISNQDLQRIARMLMRV